MQGYVFKQGRINTAWRRRWMTLTEDGIIEYRAALDKPLRGTIDMRNVVAIVRSKECRERVSWENNSPKWPRVALPNTEFALVTRKRTYFFQTLTAQENFAWIGQLERVQFDLVNEAGRFDRQRIRSVSFDETKDIRIPTYLPDTLEKSVNNALQRDVHAQRFLCDTCQYASYPMMDIVTYQQTGTARGEDHESCVQVTHCIVRNDTPIVGITLVDGTVLMEGINFAGSLTVAIATGETFCIYLPGKRTYDLGGKTGSEYGNEVVDQFGATAISRIVAIKLSALLHGADEETLDAIHGGFDEVVDMYHGRLLLHEWMHHQLIAVFVHHRQPLSYGAFIESIMSPSEAQPQHQKATEQKGYSPVTSSLSVDLSLPSTLHAAKYLRSRLHGGQPPSEYYTRLLKEDTLSGVVSGAIRRQIERLSESQSDETFSAYNPVPASLQEVRLFLLALSFEETPPHITDCEWSFSKDIDSATLAALEREGEACGPRDPVMMQVTFVSTGCKGGEHELSTTKVNLAITIPNTPQVQAVLSTKTKASLTNDDSDLASPLTELSLQADTESATTSSATMHAEASSKASVSGRDESVGDDDKRFHTIVRSGSLHAVALDTTPVEVDGIEFAAALVTTSAFGTDRRILLPGVRMYDPAGVPGSSVMGERVDENGLAFLVALTTCKALTAMHGVTDAHLTALHQAYRGIASHYVGRTGLYKWLDEQLRACLFGSSPSGLGEDVPPYVDYLCANELLPSVKGSPVAEFLSSRKTSAPRLPFTYFIACYKAENLGIVLPLEHGQVIERIVRRHEGIATPEAADDADAADDATQPASTRS